MMRRVQLLYALICTIWAAYFLHAQISVYLSGAPLRGVLLCVLVFVALPTLLGYLLLFRVSPWIAGLVRR